MKSSFQQYCSWPVCLQADNSNIHFCALGRKPLWNWKKEVSWARKCCFAMSGWKMPRVWVLELKEEELVIKQITGQLRIPGVFTRCNDLWISEIKSSLVSSGFISSFHAGQRRVSILFLLFPGTPSLWLSSPFANTVLFVTVPSALHSSAGKTKRHWMWNFSWWQFPNSALLMSLSSINEHDTFTCSDNQCSSFWKQGLLLI